ncbi:MAG: hypothetical protein IJ889_00120 [Eubacterium sp.]|nr:hypothetical protein [Eubacterium sp.]MBR2247321.1 hypothetical protein [Bacilli bacterium]
MNTRFKKLITSTVIAGLGIPGMTHQAIMNSSDYGIEEYCSTSPIIIDLQELGIDERIASVSFKSDADTEHLETEYFVQGVIYYPCDGLYEYRIFNDEVTEESEDYDAVVGKTSTVSKFYIGEERPLDVDAGAEMTIELTWVTPEKIVLSDLTLIGVSGEEYTVKDGDFYVAFAEVLDTNLVESDDELAERCLGFNRYFEVGPDGPANTINEDDFGAVSIGLIQMRGVNAQALLQAIRSTNKKEFDRIANKWSSDILPLVEVDDYSWEEVTAYSGTALHAFLEEVLIQDWAIDAQIKYLLNHEKNVIADARENGITDHRSILLYARAVNYGPYTGSSERLRELGNNGECTFENACYTIEYNRCDEAIELVNSQNFDIVTLENSRG